MGVFKEFFNVHHGHRVVNNFIYFQHGFFFLS